jgi:hypothetical protein
VVDSATRKKSCCQEIPRSKKISKGGYGSQRADMPTKIMMMMMMVSTRIKVLVKAMAFILTSY